MSTSSLSSSRSGSGWVYLIAFVALLLFGVIVGGSCSAMVSDDKAINAVEDAGYTDVEILSRSWFLIEWRGCGKGDDVRFTVRGTNVRGEVREFYVCAGVLKGGTIRSK
jgi:hypothetical protein